MKVLVIEDEKLAADKLCGLLAKVDRGIEVLEVLESVEESINWFTVNNAPDLIFMDIQLDDGISFEIFDAIKVEAPVIFTTAYDKYAIKAFKVNSIDYLLKPIEENALNAALEKFKKLFENDQNFEERVTKVIEQFARKYKSRFFIKVGSRYKSVAVSQIAYFYVEERCTFLRTAYGKSFDLDYSLDQVQKLLDPEQFFRVSRNYLININSIREIVRYSTNRLKLQIDDELHDDIVVSRDRVPEFKHWMNR